MKSNNNGTESVQPWYFTSSKHENKINFYVFILGTLSGAKEEMANYFGPEHNDIKWSGQHTPKEFALLEKKYKYLEIDLSRIN